MYTGRKIVSARSISGKKYRDARIPETKHNGLFIKIMIRIIYCNTVLYIHIISSRTFCVILRSG
jgi:hypothetical protein